MIAYFLRSCFKKNEKIQVYTGADTKHTEASKLRNNNVVTIIVTAHTSLLKEIPQEM
jgi:hypothetical protein